MREIKFRAWDPINKEMWAFVYPTWNGNVEGKKELFFDKVAKVEMMPTDNDDQPILMQYTGFRDQYGSQVYDGDVIEWSEGIFGYIKRGVVRWDDAIPGWSVTNTTSGFGYILREQMPKIIGNIYENPELLKGDS